MNRYEPQSLLTEARPPRRWVVWVVSAIVGVVTLAVIGLIFYAPIAAFKAKGFPAQPPAAVSTAAAAYTDWLPLIEVVGSLKPVRGADCRWKFRALWRKWTSNPAATSSPARS